MPTTKTRIQVTVDDELAAALEAADPAPASRARLVRDLALRGAQAVQAERQAEDEAIQILMEIADGTRDGYDFQVAADLHARRGDRLP